MKYPQTHTVEQSDEYFGTLVEDPYRWLEQGADSPEVANWITLQNDLTREQLQNYPKHRKLSSRLAELWDYAKAGPPWSRGGRWFQFRNTGLQDQHVLYTMESPDAEGRVLLDPNQLSEDGTVSLSSVAASPDGKYLAYGLNKGGSDWITWHVLEIGSGEVLPDELLWSRFSGVAWLHDSSGFVYCRYPEPPQGQELLVEMANQTVWLHRTGTEQADDTLIHERPDDPQLAFHPVVTDDGNWLVLLVSRGTEPRNYVYARRLDPDRPQEGGFHALIGDFRAEFEYIGSDEGEIYFQTDDSAPNGKVVAINVEQPDLVRTALPEQPDLLDEVRLLGDTLIATHLHHASHRVSYWSLEGASLGAAELPTLGTVRFKRVERSAKEAFMYFTSFLYPSSILGSGTSPETLVTHWSPEVPFDTSPYETVQEFATSPDGTKVPMFIVRPVRSENNGNNLTLLYGYGGFSINLTPEFSASRLAWLEAGGTFVLANLRGGLEYGKAWHEGGILSRKQNVFDDFIACAEHLIDQNYTRPERLAIQGGSNGGLLVGACITQRPDLFGAAHAAVGVLDMLRYHRFTIGWAWASDYGTSEHEDGFRNLIDYSPLHNIQPDTCYPATLLTTGDRDDRVVPAHSFKFAATLQAAQACDRPVLLRVQTKTGHGHGKPTRLLIEEQADIWAFLLQELRG